MHKIYTRKKFWLFVMPMLLLYSVFIVYPLAAAFFLSFTDYRGIGGFNWNSFGNYLRLAKDPYFFLALKNSLVCAAAMLVLVLPLSFLLALWLNKENRRNAVYKVVIFAAYVIPGVLTALIWSFILKPNGGLINELLKLIGVKGPLWINSPNGNLTMISVSIICAWSNIGFYMLLWQAGLKSISGEVLDRLKHGLEEQRKDVARQQQEAQSEIRKIFRIILPMLRENMAVICIFILTSALKIYDTVYILTSGGPMHASETIVSYLYSMTFDSMMYGYGMAIAVVEFVIAAAISVLSLLLSKKNAD